MKCSFISDCPPKGDIREKFPEHSKGLLQKRPRQPGRQIDVGLCGRYLLRRFALGSFSWASENLTRQSVNSLLSQNS